ncbi:MAG: Formylmethanofuran dehydrogenase, subunit B [Methanosarcinales archeaon 56_1174]|uniref:hypothetical protein n=1 Tax=Methermicoccus shengliensis TaxID=660064 RepID=UPI0005B2C1B3|nr:hypothetical protein [Methermicoccus shengliensis]KUK30267.1 MAG: Formylmethanofuran dehydrogenase, subunit B [Methanosarcinales archeaon 56_1174]
MFSSTVCTGCALLCDDVEVSIEEGKVEHTRQACRKGMEHLRAHNGDGALDALDDALERAAEMLKQSSSPLLYELSSLSNEGIELALELAERVGACVDFEASACRGAAYELFLTSERTVSLEWVRDNADVIAYIFCDPLSTHPRHLSMYSYYPRGEHRQQGWDKDRKTFVVDAYESATARVANRFFHVAHAEADAFFSSLARALSGRVPSATSHLTQKHILEMASHLKRAEDGVLVLGPELAHVSREGLHELLSALEGTNVRILPTFPYANSRGMSEAVYRRVGAVCAIGFDGSWHRVEGVDSPDLILSMGDDPIAVRPSLLRSRPTIISASFRPTLTGRAATLTFPMAVLGVDEGGTATRLDGEVVSIPALVHSRPGGAAILERLLEHL